MVIEIESMALDSPKRNTSYKHYAMGPDYAPSSDFLLINFIKNDRGLNPHLLHTLNKGPRQGPVMDHSKRQMSQTLS